MTASTATDTTPQGPNLKNNAPKKVSSLSVLVWSSDSNHSYSHHLLILEFRKSMESHDDLHHHHNGNPHTQNLSVPYTPIV